MRRDDELHDAAGGLVTASSWTSRLRCPPAVAVVVASAVVMLPVLLHLGDQSLYRDEAATAQAAVRAPGAFIGYLGQTDAVSGFFYLIEHVPAAFSDSEFSLRLVSWLAIVGAAAIVGVTALRLGGAIAAVSAIGLLLVNPRVWEEARNARAYALVMLMAAITTALLLHALQERPGRRAALGYLSAALALGYLHLLAATLLLAQGLALLFLPQLRTARRALVPGLLLVGALLVPLAVVGASQSFQTSWIELGSPLRIVDVGWTVLGSGVAGGLLGLLHGLGAVLAVLAASRDAVVRPAVVVLVASIAVPLTVIAVAGVRLHVLHESYLLVVLVPSAVLGGVGLARLGRLGLLPLVAVATYVVSTVNLPSLSEPRGNEDLRATAAYVAASTQAGDGALFAPDWGRPGLEWYLDRQAARPRQLGAPDQPARSDRPYLYAPPADADQLRSDVLLSRRIWVLGYVGSQAETWRPTPNVEGDLAATLPSLGFRAVQSQRFGDVGATLYVRP